MSFTYNRNQKDKTYTLLAFHVLIFFKKKNKRHLLSDLEIQYKKVDPILLAKPYLTVLKT
jgi:hypothetical protein